jgi:transcriptional antiterminator NusG
MCCTLYRLPGVSPPSRLQNDAIPESWHELNVGDVVRITDGPFAGFEGSIRELYPEKQRARVHVKVFNRETPVEIQYHQIEKL